MTQQIGVATADLYPRFSLSGFFALESGSLSNLFSSDSVTWGIGLPVRWRIFDGGRIRSNIDVQKARTDQALKLYEKSVLIAIEEIEATVRAPPLEVLAVEFDVLADRERRTNGNKLRAGANRRTRSA